LLRNLVAQLDELDSAAITARYVGHHDPDPVALLAELAAGTEIANRMRSDAAPMTRKHFVPGPPSSRRPPQSH